MSVLDRKSHAAHHHAERGLDFEGTAIFTHCSAFCLAIKREQRKRQ
jgi:hypothetical protein